MPKWLKDAVFYEIYPQSFYDTNGDGIGDFDGIIEKLDYIRGLGCNALWINPCFDSPFKDGGYDVRNYKKTAPRYGSNSDLYRLFGEAHKRGIHVLLDLVPGHTSEEHAWFLESKKAEKSEYSNRYIWTNNCFRAPKKYPYIGGETERDGVYLLNFFKCQPALNYGFLNCEEDWQLPVDHPDCVATREAMKDVIRFWLDHGCDGFRVDMADSLVKNDDEKKSGTCAIWRNIREMLDEEYPEAAFVSEWNNPERSLNAAGFHMDFYLNWSGNGYSTLLRDYESGEDNSFFKKDGKGDITRFLDEYLPRYTATKGKGYYCLLTCNHDTIRPKYNLDDRELKLVYAFFFTMPGVPFLYYGDEIGMRYLKVPTKEGGYFRTGSRTPMQWNAQKNAGFSDCPEDTLYLPTDPSADAPNVAAQEADENSLLNTVKALLWLRHGEEDLQADADFEVIYAKSGRLPFIYRRGNILIALNPSGEIVSAPVEAGERKLLFAIGGGKTDADRITLEPQSCLVLKLQLS
ncbi:MAG: glycosylase [Lachnospiraceae bacterium]|nr:glycosylase [Lachnospiraceae bacterium]